VTQEPLRAAFLYLARYRYTGDVIENDNIVRVFPYQDEGQVPEHSQFLLIPSGSGASYIDGYGSPVRRVRVVVPHRELIVASSGMVRLYPLDTPLPQIPRASSISRAGLLPQFLSPSPLVDPDKVRDVALDVADGDTELVSLVDRISEWVYANVEYRQGVTDLATTAADVLRIKQGVCQDIAHLALGMLRALWIPCRYVSGLLIGEAGETHAWLEFWHPEAGWVGCDPTRNVSVVTGPDHVKFAVGRDYSDVTPVQGEYRGECSGYLDKVVAEARLEEETLSIDQALAVLATA
jgi:transglutaminase-like putative cysteine protease